MSLILITGITGFLAGLYPAFCLTSFNPVDVLKGSALSGTGNSAFRRITAVIQFVISIALIIGTITVYKQLVFMQSMRLGFDKENLMVITADNNQVRQNYEVFRNGLLDNTASDKGN